MILRGMKNSYMNKKNILKMIGIGLRIELISLNTMATKSAEKKWA